MSRTATAASTLLTNLVEFWTLDEASGNRVGRVAGTALAPTNAPGNATGKLSNALSCVAASSQGLSLGAGSAGSFSPGNNAFTVAAWVKFSSIATNQVLIAKGDAAVGTSAGANSEWTLRRRNSDSAAELLVCNDATGTVTTSGALTATLADTVSWHLVVAQYTGSLLQVWVDNVATPGFTINTTLYAGNNSVPLTIGYCQRSDATKNSFLDALLDGVGYWSRALTTYEVGLLWNNGNGLDYPFNRPLAGIARSAAASSSLLTSLTDYWTLDEASGNRKGALGTVLSTINNPVNAAGKLNKGLNLVSASTQALQLLPTDQTKFTPGMGSMTVGAWVNLATLGADLSVMSKWNSGSGQDDWAFYYINSSTSFRLILVADSAITKFAIATGAVHPAVSTWHFVVGWFDAVAQTANIQIDNGAIQSGAANAQFAATGVFQGTASLRIGTQGGSSMNGVIDGAFYYSRTLTSIERGLLWNNGNGLDYPFSRGVPGIARGAA
jgi:Concanavalin A-like lectin/glucanases superfamily